MDLCAVANLRPLHLRIQVLLTDPHPILGEFKEFFEDPNVKKVQHITVFTQSFNLQPRD